MIEVSNLTKYYGETAALSSVSFVVPKGKIVGFLGANGAGKTTTMDIITGVSGADAGRVRVCGHDILDEPIEAKMKLGYLPDEPPIYHDMRVIDFVRHAALLRRVPSTAIRSRVADTIEKLSLGEVQNRLVGNLSKGYKQRVGLAQALVHDPEVLILDEPTEGLDPNQIVQIRDLIKSLAGQHTILLSSHILSEVQNTCDLITIINKGRIVQSGTYDSIVATADGAKPYQVAVMRDMAGLAEKLKALNGIRSVRVLGEDQKAEIVVDSVDVLDTVAKTIVNGSYGFLEVSASRKSLEEVFIKLTH